MIDKEIIAVFHYDDKGSKCCGAEPYRYAEEIIRCKECKCARNIESEWICEHLSGMAGLNVLVNADDFCSYGQKERASDDERRSKGVS